MSTMEKQNTSRTRRSFTEEFKTDAAIVLDDGREIVDMAAVVSSRLDTPHPEVEVPPPDGDDPHLHPYE